MKLASIGLLFLVSIPMIAGDSTKRVYTVAGGYVGDWRPATSAALSGPKYSAMDSKGNIYVSDDGHCRVRKIQVNGNITTVAGTGICGFSGDGGPATKAEINHPSGIAIDSKGNVFFSEIFNSRIREVSASGNIQTVAGNGVFGFCGDGGPATNACFQFPAALAVDEGGGGEALFVADTYNNRVRQIDLATGIVSTVAGNGTGGYTGDGGPATSAELSGPQGLAVRSQPHLLWISDTSNGAIRKIDLSTGVITTFFGNGKCDTTLCFPEGMSLDASGNIYVAADGNGVVLEIDASSGISTIKAGNGGQGFSGDGGEAASAVVNVPQDVLVDSMGNLIIVDTGNDRLRSVSKSGIISTIAGGYMGDGAKRLQSSFNGPSGLALDNAGSLYIADSWNNRIRKVSATGISTIAGTGISGSTGDGRPATAAELWEPLAVAVDKQDNVYIADYSNFAIRKLDPLGIITTFASTVFINALTVDSSGNLYGADPGSCVIRKFTPSGQASIVAGMLYTCGYNGDEISATQAEISFPWGLVVDSSGNLYFADNGNNRVRMVDTQGMIHTVAGNGSCGFSGDGALATLAQLCGPFSVGLDRKNNLYIADTYNGRIRVVNPSGIIQAFAGDGGGGYNGNGLPATQVNMEPFALTVSPSGIVYYPDGPMVRMVH
jgi:sugar lactone lactonase YvrE